MTLALVAVLELSLIGCTPVAVVAGSTYGVGLAVDRAMHCMTRRCDPPPSPEVVAAMENDVEKLRTLVAGNPNIARDPEVLRGAIVRGADDVVRFLVPKYTEPNLPQASTLGLALSWGRCSTADLLLTLGAREYGYSPTVSIVSAGTLYPSQASACYDLLKKYVAASTEVSSIEKNRAILYASIYSAPMVSLLLSIGANPTYVEYDGNTPMHWASRGPRPADRRERNVDSSEIISLLIHAGDSNLDRQNIQGDTPLHFAIENGNVAAAKWLIAKGANPNIPNAMGKTPSTLAKEKNIDLFAP